VKRNKNHSDEMKDKILLAIRRKMNELFGEEETKD
jgi:hypothetical protein